jgi:tetratricopeptide (TPR) repeat protein
MAGIFKELELSSRSITMKPRLPKRILFAIPLLFLACSVLQPDPQAEPGSPASIPATQTVDASLAPTPVVKLSENDMVCPSDNRIAQQFYNEAGDQKDRGSLAEAEELYRKAIELDPEFCDAMDNLGQLLREQNKINEAIGWYQKSLEIVPENPVAVQNLAVAYEFQGETEKALEQYQRLTEVAPENPEGYYGLGNLYFRSDQAEKAIPYFETAEKLYIEQGSPYVADAQYNLGFSHFVLGDCTKAMKYMQPLSVQFAEDGGMNYVLGICYLTTEPTDKEAAREHILKAQELGITIPTDVLEAIDEK